ncbi:hypothetical protein FBUS_11486, partial [Fasciolopsis buskii]
TEGSLHLTFLVCSIVIVFSRPIFVFISILKTQNPKGDTDDQTVALGSTQTLKPVAQSNPVGSHPSSPATVRTAPSPSIDRGQKLQEDLAQVRVNICVLSDMLSELEAEPNATDEFKLLMSVSYAPHFFLPAIDNWEVVLLDLVRNVIYIYVIWISILIVLTNSRPRLARPSWECCSHAPQYVQTKKPQTSVDRHYPCDQHLRSSNFRFICDDTNVAISRWLPKLYFVDCSGKERICRDS